MSKEKVFRYEINSPTCITETLDDDTVVLNLETGNYYNMLGLSSYVWDSFCNAMTISEVITSLKSKGLNTSDLEENISNFLKKLNDEGLLKISERKNKIQTPVLSTIPKSLELDFEIYSDMKKILMLDPIHDVNLSKGWPN